MAGQLAEGADWIEAIRKASEDEREKARELLEAYKAFDLIEMLDL
jgi:hypothetical protein